ncbi:unnamed protein product, partial [Thelazia callipaeda]|uniref:Ion_trans_2 domain-containing protein n=1 Tax=Thelazia callipaeda TaxID=103827 RepID=A0A0N5CSF5_THECL
KLSETDYHNSNHVEEKWSFLNAIIFSYTVITTIGYGHITPVTTEGRIFCIIYGSIGIPFTLLTIADLGMFISKVCGDSVILGIAFLTYLIFGAYAFSLYEPDMDFFTAIYFNFVTLTTIGLGDLVPRREKYLIVTLIYITIGLALTTRAMERAANLLKKIHYFGRQIENISQMTVWFGGQKYGITVFHLGDKMNVPINDLINLNIDKFVESAIKVEEGEITSLRVLIFLEF